MTKSIGLSLTMHLSLVEQTIELTPEEFDSLAKADGKRVRKIRHYLENTKAGHSRLMFFRTNYLGSC